MFDVRGCAAVVAAVIEQARKDASGPKSCPTQQRDWVQRDAQEFLVEVVQPAAAECLLDVIIPYRRQRRVATGAVRWDMTADERTRKREWARQRAQVAGIHAGRK